MSERSAEERERARQERERRRLGASGGEDAVLEPAPAQEDQDWLQEDSEPPLEPDEDWLQEDPEPPAAPVARSGRRPGRRSIPPRAGEQRAGGAPRGVTRTRGPGRHSRAGRALALLALVLVALVLWFLIELFQPFNGAGHGRVTVTIPPRSTTSQIADLLDRAGVISCSFPSCSFLFELRAKLDGRTLRSGQYHLKLGMTFEDVIGVLSSAPPSAPVKEVTVIPGETRRHLSAVLQAQHVRGNYYAATRRSAILKPSTYGAPPGTPSLEGFLFPDTYQLLEPISVSALVADQLRDFKRRFSTVDLSYARSHNLTAYDVLIVASLITKEATTTHDFPLVASTIYNRLRLNMPLQLDSTTQYATGNYNRPLTVSQLNSPSPWNTHTHRGLPPTPIDSPALAAIQAAAHPASTNYLYFVSKPCKSGALAFSPSYSQQLINEQRLQDAHGRYSAKC